MDPIDWTESGSSFTRKLATYTFSVIKLPHESTDISSDILIIITALLYQIELIFSPVIMSASPEGNYISENVSGGKFASVLEPLPLLLLGTGLIGIDLYRRLRNK